MTTTIPPTPASHLARTLGHTPDAADPARLTKAATDFEAMAIGQLLQPMFQTPDLFHDSLTDSAGEEAWKPMLVDEIGKQIAAHGGLGWEKPIYDAMAKAAEEGSR